MRIPRFFSPVPLSPNASHSLDGQVAKHITRVLRMQPNDALVLFDGRGGEYPARIEQIQKQMLSVRTADHHARETESPLKVELGIAISRGERMDQVIQKATELGVSRIAPLFSERTEVRLRGDRAARKQLHWQQIAISACEQSGRNRPPDIDAISKLDEWINRVDARLKFVLHHRTEQDAMHVQSCSQVALLVGPEGGLSPGEIAAAESAGFIAMGLGPRVLRTETAPLVALTLLQSRFGDLPG